MTLIEPVEVKIKTKTYKLQFDLASVKTAEKATGVKLLFGLYGGSDPSTEFMQSMFYASLVKFQPSISFDAAQVLLPTPKRIVEMFPTVLEAWKTSFPEEVDEEEDTAVAGESQDQN